MEPHKCPHHPDTTVKFLPKEWLGGYEYQYYICPVEGCKYRGFKQEEMDSWNVTIERDFTVKAKSQEDAERLVKEKYGGQVTGSWKAQ